MSTETTSTETGSDRPGLSTSRSTEKKKGGFFRWLFSHLIVAAIAVAGAAAYFHWTGMMAGIEGYVCSDDMLGRYAAKPEPDKTMTGESAAPQSSRTSETPAIQSSSLISPSVLATPEMGPFETSWMEARRTYRQDNAEAQEAYRALIEQRPEIADLHGELGNVYYQANARQKAASEYFQAGKFLIRQGEKKKAGKVIRILEQLDPERADRLNRELYNGD